MTARRKFQFEKFEDFDESVEEDRQLKNLLESEVTISDDLHAHKIENNIQTLNRDIF